MTYFHNIYGNRKYILYLKSIYENNWIDIFDLIIDHVVYKIYFIEKQYQGNKKNGVIVDH